MEGGRQAQATWAGRSWGALESFSPRPPPPSPPRPSRLPQQPEAGARAEGQGLACGGEAVTPPSFLARAETLGQGPGHQKMNRRVTEGAGAIGSNDRVRFMNNVPRNAFWSLGC